MGGRLRWLVYVGRVLIWISILAGATLCSLLLLTTLFEALGAIFFDELVIRFEERTYGERLRPLSWRENFRYLGQSLSYSCGTAVWALLLLIPPLLIPVAGLIPAVAVVGYRFGLNYAFSSAFARRIDVREVRRPRPAASGGRGRFRRAFLSVAADSVRGGVSAPRLRARRLDLLSRAAAGHIFAGVLKIRVPTALSSLFSVRVFIAFYRIFFAGCTESDR